MKKIYVTILLFLMYIIIFAVPIQAETNGKMYVSGMMSDDEIEFYRIASYDENGEYTWDNNVSKYLASVDTESSAVLPSELSKLDEDSAKAFCSSVILNVKKDSVGKPDIPFISRTGSTMYSVDMVPGGYIILVNGAERIYDMKFVEIMPQQTLYVDYTGDDYNSPKIDVSLKNLTQDRQADDTGAIWTLIDDKIQMEAVINLPFFYDIYKDSENSFLKFTVHFPDGTDYIENSISIKKIQQNEEFLLKENEDFVVKETENSHCLEILLEESLLEESFLFSGIKIICDTEKNVIGHKNGSLDFKVECEYSKSPLNSEFTGKMKNTAAICFYGINFVSCAGDGISDITDKNAVLKNAKKLSGTAIDIYKYLTSVPANDEAALQKAVIELGDTKYYTISSENVNEKLIYVYVGTVTTDENGEAFVGGLTIDDYLVTESNPPKGYDFFSSFQKVSKDEWSNQEVSDNQYMVSAILIHYKGVTLPGSGIGNAWKFWIMGGIIVIIVIAIRVWIAYRNSVKKRENNMFRENNEKTR